MLRDRKTGDMARFDEDHMASSLTVHPPSSLFEYLDRIRPGKDG